LSHIRLTRQPPGIFTGRGRGSWPAKGRYSADGRTAISSAISLMPTSGHSRLGWPVQVIRFSV
jgi:hypothetical protein